MRSQRLDRSGFQEVTLATTRGWLMASAPGRSTAPALGLARAFTTVKETRESAILVEPKSVWLALANYHEYGQTGHGLLRFDRVSETFQKIDIGPGIGFRFVKIGDGLILATDFGISVLKDYEATQYFVDKTSDGRLRVAQANK